MLKFFQFTIDYCLSHQLEKQMQNFFLQLKIISKTNHSSKQQLSSSNELKSCNQGLKALLSRRKKISNIGQQQFVLNSISTPSITYYSFHQRPKHLILLAIITLYQIVMKKLTQILLLALLLTFINASIASKYHQFKSYAHQYGKRYESKIVQYYRFAIYLKNMLEIERMNADPNDHALYGQTKFTDLTVSQARALMGLIVPAFPEFNYVQNFTNDPEYKPKSTTPDIWNWVQQGVVGPIKDQGSCGSCWTFSTAGNIQSLNFMTGKDQQLVTLSEQQLVDCDKSNFGCGGGWPYKAIDWLANNGGLMNDKDYPLRTNYSGPCQFNEQKQRIKIKGYMNVTHDETIIKDALYETGPLSILLDFTGLMHYKSGVANPLLCSTWPDHALVLVGYGTKDHDYWLIKNSWGPKWGINGYFMLKRGANKCGINLWATTAVLDN